MLADISSVDAIYIVCGRTDMCELPVIFPPKENRTK